MTISEKVRGATQALRDALTPSGNAPFDSAEKMEKAFTDVKWDVAFTTHPKYYDGSALRPWFFFKRSNTLGDWTVTEGFHEVTDAKTGATVERKLEGSCKMQGDPKRPWEFEIKQSGLRNVLSKATRWRIVHYDEVDGVAAACYDKTFDLQDKPSCHVLVRNMARHVMRDKDKESPEIRSAMDAIRRQYNYRDMGGDIKPCAGTPFVKVHPYMV